MGEAGYYVKRHDDPPFPMKYKTVCGPELFIFLV